jgi:thermitase
VGEGIQLRFQTRVLAAAAVALLSPAAATGAPAVANPPRDETTILVKFLKPSASTPFATAVGELPTKVKIVKVMRGMTIDRLLAIYRSLPNVAYAEPNYVARFHLAAPNDPFYGQQWALSRIAALDGWTTYPGSFAGVAGAPIAFVDTGVEATHPDLSGRVQSGANCLTGACVAGASADDNGHGTLGAGIAAAGANNGAGLAGVSFGSPIIPVKTLDASGSGTYGAIAAGVTWAVDHGARVINLSLAGDAYSRTLCDAVAYAIGKGALIAAAAGNFGNSAAVYPAACPGAVGVTSTQPDDSAAPFANSGSPDVFVSAPGTQVHTTYINGTYALATGTSMSTSFVSGLAGLLLGQRPQRSVADVKRILATTSDKVGAAPYGADPYGTCSGCTWSTTHGYGRINVRNALAAANVEPDPPPVVEAAAPDFTIAASPTAVSVVRGVQAAYTISIGSEHGFAGSVALSATGLPAGAVASFAPASVLASGSSTLAVATTSAAPAGSYTFTVRGTSGSLTHTLNVSLTVTVPPPPTASFTLTATPGSRILKQGRETTFRVTVNGPSEVQDAIEFSVAGLPPGVTSRFVRTTTRGLWELVLAAPANATRFKTHELTITGAVGSTRRTVTVSVIVL